MTTLAVRELDDRVVVTLCRPEARNAINAAMVGELHDVCAGLEERPRLLLLTGDGGVFAAGADIAELRGRGRPANELMQHAYALLDRMARSGPLALRLTKLVLDAPGGHPVADDLAQAILFESDDKRARMDAFLAGGRR